MHSNTSCRPTDGRDYFLGTLSNIPGGITGAIITTAVSTTAVLYQPEAGRLRAVVIMVYVVISLDKNLLNPWIPFPGSSWLVDFNLICLQCFDTVGWASGRASGL